MASVAPVGLQEGASLVCPSEVPRFADYPAEVFDGPPRWPVVHLGADSLDMGRRSDYSLAYSMDHRPDFAGHLRVVESGCGSPCQVQTLVDVRTGEVVGSTVTSLGASYRLESRLFVANPPDSTGCYEAGIAYGKPSYWAWNGTALDSVK